MEELTPTEAFVRRLRETRRRARISQEDLHQRLQDIGFKVKAGEKLVPLSRSAIAQIELGRRRVTLDEALAIAAALGVAPVHLMAPFETDRLPEQAPGVIPPEDLTELGIFEVEASLKIGDKLVLLPAEARKWIRGKTIYQDASTDLWHRYYCIEVPPVVKHWLRQLAGWVRKNADNLDSLKLPSTDPPSEEQTVEMAVPAYPTKKMRGFPAPLWTWLMFEPKEEE